jgi:ABC-type multidrug transport system fused ATPase/permease subunit
MRDKIKLYISLTIQIFLAFLEFITLALFWLVLSNGVASSRSLQENYLVGKLVKVAQSHGGFTILILLFILVFRSFSSFYVTAKLLKYFTSKTAEISTGIFKLLTNESILKLEKRSSQALSYSLTRGVEFLFLNVVSPSLVLLSDLVLCLFFFILLFSVNIGSTILLGILILLVNLTSKAISKGNLRELGQKAVGINVSSAQLLDRLLTSYREIFVNDSQNKMVSDFKHQRQNLSLIHYQVYLRPFINKYLVEISILFGAGIVGLSQYILLTDKRQNFLESILIFMIIGMRLAPSLLRVQQGLVQLETGIGLAGNAKELVIDYYSNGKIPNRSRFMVTVNNSLTSDNPLICVKDVAFHFHPSKVDLFSNINFQISKGEFVLIKGPSGYGKSTLLDLILGIYSPTQGDIFINGLPPIEFIKKYPQAISYVPQNIKIYEGTVFENIELGSNLPSRNEMLLEKVLAVTSLDSIYSKSPKGIHSFINDRGTLISGGERQRLGIARALYKNPSILILDEATNALDSESEEKILNSIKEFNQELTLIMIKHGNVSLSLIDKVISLKP